MNRLIKFVLFLVVCLNIGVVTSDAWTGMRMPELFIKGRYLMAKDTQGNDSIVNLHGFGQTYSAYFNGYAWCKDANGNIKWDWASQHNVSNCVYWNKTQIASMLKKGWKVNWMRLHMDPHWTNGQGKQQTGGGGEADITAFDFETFKTNFDKVFLVMANYAISKGLYVVMRPPGVCPHNIAVGDDYQKYLLTVWKYVANHPKVKNNMHIMFELANEPVAMADDNGNFTNWSDGSKKNCTKFFQQIIDAIRAEGCNNILWVPGLNWQQSYDGYVKYPLKGENLGLAVHCYPGWYGSDSEADGGSVEQGVVTKGNTYFDFQAGWDASLKDAANKYPIIITEMDWAPKAYNSSWGKATTGKLGGTGFGANFRYIMDKTGNVSWMLFTDADKLAMYDDAAPDGKTFLTDPEACPRMCYRWFEEYSNPEWKFEDTLADQLYYFPGTESSFNASIWESGTCVKNEDGTHTITTGQYGFAGWKFPQGLALSAWKYLIVKYKAKPASTSWSFRVFDADNYWGKPYMKDAGTSDRLIVPLQYMTAKDGGAKVDPKHVYILGWWSYGNTPLTISDIYLTNNSDYSKPTGTDDVFADFGVEEHENGNSSITDIFGRKVTSMRKGQIYIINGNKIAY